jgi:2-(1,2-epoxy-1,2-dihydrophenyl)acetyl-CoA isomerase
MSNFVTIETFDNIALLTMDRPETRNALSSDEDCDSFVDALRYVDGNPAVRAVVLTGAGGCFSAGGNLKAMKERTGFGRGRDPVQTRENYRRNIQRIPRAFQAIEVPVIALIDGPAIGAGLDIACMCDIRMATDRARFAESFVRVGIIPGDGGAWLLQRIIGYSRAMQLSLTGDAIDAAVAQAWNLVSEVLPVEEALPAALELARKIAANPRSSVRLTKSLVRKAQDCGLDVALELSSAFQAIAHETVDHAEALDAFIEKRPPVFNRSPG